VDKVTFTAFGGTPLPYWGDGSQFVMDDLVVGSGITTLVNDDEETLVTIDIKPGSDTNPINPGSKGVIPVAVLRTGSFNPLDIVPDSLRFGKTGEEESFAKCAVEDVNEDGQLDLICHFRTAATGFACGDSVGYLKGTANGGTPVSGSDAVQIGPCKKR
jgi:hypothetical protein